MDRKVFTFSRKVRQSLVVTNDINPINYAMSWTLNSLPNYTEFTNLFDQYRINYIEVKFIYDHNVGEVASSAGIAANANMGLPNVYLARDYDDASALGGIDEYLQYEGCIVRRLGDIFSIRIYPHIASAAYSGTFTSYKNDTRAWIDVNSTGVAHYGLKMGVDASMCNSAAGAAVAIGRLTLIHTYNISFKNVR